jgi:hypothetical protein
MIISMRKLLILPTIAAAMTATAAAQIAQPYLTSISPSGALRGSKVTFTIEGFNLVNAGDVLWSRSGIESTVTLNSEIAREAPRPSKDPTKKLSGDRGVRNRLTIEASVAPDAAIGFYSFRIRTSLGTTNSGRIYIGSLPEMKERETNDSLADAQAIILPIAVLGEIQKTGDTDHFKFKAKAGHQLVFEVIAAPLNSKLDSALTLFDEDGRTLASGNDYKGSRDSLLAHTFNADGEYTVRISDFTGKGDGEQYEYRLNIGELPFVTGVFPLGLRQDSEAELALSGFNLGVAAATVRSQPLTQWGATTRLNLKSPSGEAFNNPMLAVGRYPEVMEQKERTSLAAPHPVAIPSTVNGRIYDRGAGTDEDFYRFRARKGQRLTLEVEAQRFGSPLDSVIEVLGAKGGQIPRIVARCVLETQLTLNDRDSANRGFRLLSWNGINVNDYLLAGNELVQIDVLPKGPDEDTFMKSFLGQRIAFEDTTPEAHAVNSIAYKVTLHPPGTKLAPNGLPVITIHYRNDDGGPMFGKDSRLNFTAPADGDYIVRIRDVRGMHGEDFAYRLSIHEPEPDFVLSADPENPNVPRGGSLPITVTAYRADGLDGDIEVRLLDLPAGFTATGGVIRAGQNSTVITISASASADASFPLRVQATAAAGGRRITRELNTGDRIAIVSAAPEPELLVWTEPAQVALEPGGHAFVSIRIKRERGFEGRVPFDVRNLPHGVIVTDVGLNGVMITEEETTQRFRLAAESWVEPLSQPVFVVGRIETASPQRSDFPASPFTLVIRPKEKQQAGTQGGRR